MLSLRRLSRLSFSLVLLCSLAGAAAAQGYDPLKPKARPPEDGASAPPHPDYENLPDAPGVEETYYLCTGCHSAAIIKQQRLSDARWDYLWRWMIEEQGMPETDEETKATILGYLKQYFSSER